MLYAASLDKGLQCCVDYVMVLKSKTHSLIHCLAVWCISLSVLIAYIYLQECSCSYKAACFTLYIGSCCASPFFSTLLSWLSHMGEQLHGSVVPTSSAALTVPASLRVWSVTHAPIVQTTPMRTPTDAVSTGQLLCVNEAVRCQIFEWQG